MFFPPRLRLLLRRRRASLQARWVEETRLPASRRVCWLCCRRRSGPRWRVGGGVGEGVEDLLRQRGAQGVVERAQAELGEGLVEAGDAGAVEGVAELLPGLLGGGAELAPVEQDGVLIAAQVEVKPLVVEVGGAAEVLEAAGGVALGEEDGVVGREREGVA